MKKKMGGLETRRKGLQYLHKEGEKDLSKDVDCSGGGDIDAI